MSDWTFLNKHRARTPGIAVPAMYCSDDSDGFNGLFRLPRGSETVRCVASDGWEMDGPEWKWKHVSVSIERDKRPPKWEVMCWIKDLFWEPEDWVVQFHPAQSQYINYHPGCLHLWQPLVEKLPMPLSIMVGPKSNRPVSELIDELRKVV